MSKMTIIEGNSNDKDNTRVFMVKGEKGFSPTVTISKTAGVTTITITDVEGTHTAQINDGEAFAVTEETGIQDCNNYKVAGMYHFTDIPAHTPTNTQIGWLSVISSNSGDTKQIWLQEDANIYTRFYNNTTNTWSSWAKSLTPKSFTLTFVNPASYENCFALDNIININFNVYSSNEITADQWVTVATIPTGYRPSSNVYLNAFGCGEGWANPVAVPMSINTNGEISVRVSTAIKRVIVSGSYLI